jgi:hypothetical protein
VRGRTPKPAATRQRRNKTATKASLPTEAIASGFTVPPKRGSRTVTAGDKATSESETVAFEESAEGWHTQVVAWWRSVWTSPMAQEYTEADRVGGLALLAELWHRWWLESDTRVLSTLSTTINQLSREFGLSPMSRRSLQWEIEKGEQAADRTARRRQSRELEATSKKDPRSVLKVV